MFNFGFGQPNNNTNNGLDMVVLVGAVVVVGGHCRCYRCYSVAMHGKSNSTEMEKGDKIVMPQSLLTY